MRSRNPTLLIPICMLIGLNLTACNDNKAEAPVEHNPAPRLNPGMRAYVDPVTGEYTTPPPELLKPKPQVGPPAASAVSPKNDAAKPQEIPLPDGGVMIELGDQFQTQGKAPE